MLTIFVSFLSFVVLLTLGIICMFLSESAWIMTVPFILYLFILKAIYKDGNCITLEYKDFIITGIFSLVFFYLYRYVEDSAQIGQLSFIYLITFISSIQFINTIRFKSLI